MLRKRCGLEYIRIFADVQVKHYLRPEPRNSGRSVQQMGGKRWRGRADRDRYGHRDGDADGDAEACQGFDHLPVVVAAE